MASNFPRCGRLGGQDGQGRPWPTNESHICRARGPRLPRVGPARVRRTSSSAAASTSRASREPETGAEAREARLARGVKEGGNGLTGEDGLDGPGSRAVVGGATGSCRSILLIAKTPCSPQLPGNAHALCGGPRPDYRRMVVDARTKTSDDERRRG